MEEKRQFKKLRISLTDTCNLACTYCVEDEKGHQMPPENGAKPLTLNEFVATIETLHTALQLESVRLTGGEPLLYRNIVPLVAAIKAMGISNIGLTTNAYYLKSLAAKLKRAGVSSINVSLDALDAAVFKTMTRKPLLEKTLEGIHTANRLGIPMKINAVILKGMNDNQVLPLLNFGRETGIPVRFLELMRMGYLHHKYAQYFYPEKEMLQLIERTFTIHPEARVASSTANYWKLEGTHYRFGIIANESTPFCADCNRLRLDSYGNIYGCISSANGVSLKNATLGNKQQVQESLVKAMQQKQNVKFVGSELSMQYLGG